MNRAGGAAAGKNIEEVKNVLKPKPLNQLLHQLQLIKQLGLSQLCKQTILDPRWYLASKTPHPYSKRFVQNTLCTHMQTQLLQP